MRVLVTYLDVVGHWVLVLVAVTHMDTLFNVWHQIPQDDSLPLCCLFSLLQLRYSLSSILFAKWH